MLKNIGNRIPQRYILGVMGFLCTSNSYALRVVLNVAITQMSIQQNTQYTDPGTCPGNDPGNSTSHSALKTIIKNPVYDWDESTKGLILSSFFWGYVVTHLPGGIWSEKYGGKHILGVGMLIASVFTVLTPWIVVASNGNWVILVVTRIFVGLGQGTSNPAINALLAKWVPPSERSTIGTMVYSGSQVGTILSSSICGALITATETWSSVFYFFGISGILWFIFWQILCYSSPEQHPFIGEEEREFLENQIEGVSKVRPPIPWKAFSTSGPLWALIAAQAGHDWGFYTILTDLPSYMSEVLKFNILDDGIWNSIPYIVMWICSMGSGKLCDWMIGKTFITITFARKFFTTLSSIGPTIFIMAASYSGCNKAITVGMFTIALFFTGPFYCGFKVNALDISPNHAGILMAIANGAGAITGGVVPYLAGALTEDHTLKEWRTVFWITGAVFVITSIIFCIWGSGEVQDWNDMEASTTEKSEKLHQSKAKANQLINEDV